MNARPSGYPLRIEGTLAPRLSRGLSLVKWLLAIPHVIAILVTGRYPLSGGAPTRDQATQTVHQFQAVSATTGDLI